ncbi:MAG: hypothetical protein A2289_00935 [Deltaproteobacteria bacterium RIFOXYA12_FULL_58_15]|nr:MAG: hypothetical protein A2289_00935 [Deltaproteobacteria bacterium RIFOXYA12_FULL_58_15]OGR14756.1 MAG: hypothetical protein A2341_05275 [Deltaproteobacteria bacterium RIFOXYB12_FULL_58_9]
MGTDWPQGRHDAKNSAQVRFGSAEVGKLVRWEFHGSDRVWGYQPGMTVWTSPAVALVGGRAALVIGSYDHNIYSLDATTGVQLWRFTTGDSVYANPVIWNDGEETWVFATSTDRLVYALDAELGSRKWIHSLETFRPTLGGARLSSPNVGIANGKHTVFVGHWIWDRSLARSQQEGGITALDARTGEVIWRRLLGDNEITAPTYAQIGARHIIAAGSANGTLHVLDANTGDVLWNKTELDAIRAAPAITSQEGGRVVYSSNAGIVRCLDVLSGDEVWSYQTGNWVTASPMIADIDRRLVVVVGSYDRSLYALDLLTGVQVWRYFAEGGVYAAAALALLPGQPLVLTSAWDHHLHAVDGRDGSKVWQVYTGRPLWDAIGLEHSNWASPIAVEINGHWGVYSGSYDGVLRAFPLDDVVALRSERERSNLIFWLSFPIALACVALFSIALTRQHRKHTLDLRAGSSRELP